MLVESFHVRTCTHKGPLLMKVRLSLKPLLSWRERGSIIAHAWLKSGEGRDTGILWRAGASLVQLIFGRNSDFMLMYIFLNYYPANPCLA